MTLLAYRFALDPAPAQERVLRSHAGAARVAFNWGLARVKAVMDQRAAETTYGIIGDDLSPALSWSLYSLRKDWNAAKDTAAPWWAECSKEAFNTGLDQLARALKNWGDSRKGQRKGKRAGFPRFKSRRKARPSIRFTTGAFRCEARHAVLPRIGRVKLHEPGTRLADLVAAGTARVLAVSVRFGPWFRHTLSTRSRPSPADPAAVTGWTWGSRPSPSYQPVSRSPTPGTWAGRCGRFATCPAPCPGNGARIGGPGSSRRTGGSAVGGVGKVQGRVADQRRDALHKATTDLTSRFGSGEGDERGARA